MAAPMRRDQVSNVVYLRMDKETAISLTIACFRMGKTKQEFVMEVLLRALGLDGVPPKPSRESFSVPEVAGLTVVGKAEEAPEPQINPPGSLIPVESSRSLSSGPSRCYVLPKDFRDEDHIKVLLEYAMSLGVFEPLNELDQFCDYHVSKGSKFRDWYAAWRTWCRNAIKFQKKSSPNATSIHSEKMRVAGQIFGKQEQTNIFEGQSYRVKG